MALVLLIALGFALVMFPTLRCAVSHPVSLIDRKSTRLNSSH